MLTGAFWSFHNGFFLLLLVSWAIWPFLINKIFLNLKKELAHMADV
jgi:hypothetical protein